MVNNMENIIVQNNKSSTCLNVKDFGAVGDGIADDTLAIQRAVSKALNTRGSVYIPSGKYRITATINCIPIWGKDVGPGLGPNGEILTRSGCSILGEHRRGTIIFADFDSWQTINIKGQNVCQYYLIDGTLKPIQEKPYGQPIKYLTDKIVFYYAEYMTFSDMWVIKKDNGINPQGIAFSTPYSIQNGWSTFQRLNIELFDYGIWHRFTLYSSFKDIVIQNCRVGIRFARVDDRYPKGDNRNPSALSDWNDGNGGWFHNVVTFDNCSIKGNAKPNAWKMINPGVTEVGFWGCPMATVFTSCTCEDIYRNKEAKNNRIAPKGMPGTGIFIEDGRGFNEGKGITFEQFYTEVTERPIYVINTKDININSGFMEGVFNPISATNAVFEFSKCRPVNIRGNIIIPGIFKYFISAKNNSMVLYDDYTGGVRWLGDFSKDFTSNIIKRNFNNFNNQVLVQESKWYGKQMNCIGDDITCGIVISTNEHSPYSWVEKVQTLLQLDSALNYGINGSTIATKSSDPNWNKTRQPMCLRYSDMDDDGEIICCLGGINDFCMGVPLGNFKSRNTDTFYGALHVLYSGIVKKYPTKAIFIMTCIQVLPSKFSNGQGITLKQWTDAQREVAEYYSIPILDLYNNCGINYNIPEQMQILIPDGIHPNQLGIDIIARKIANFIETL